MNNILKLSIQFEKLAQQFISVEKGVYEDVLEKSNLWFDDNSIYNLLDKHDINQVNLSVTIDKNLIATINVTGKHPKISLFTKDINNIIGAKMTNALQKAAINKKIVPPPSPVVLKWKTNFGYQ